MQVFDGIIFNKGEHDHDQCTFRLPRQYLPVGDG